jgi:hypothetical protein
MKIAFTYRRTRADYRTECRTPCNDYDSDGETAVP